MSVGISVKGVKPFDGTNFQGWKAQVNALFVMNDVLDIVDGTREEPVAGAGYAVALKKNVKDDATAKFIILSNLDEAQQVCVLSCSSAKEMWNKLCPIHEQKTATNKLGLLQRFHAYRMSEADTAVQHVARVSNMASQLKDVGENISDATIMAKILASLTTRFSTLQVAWDSVDAARQTLDNLQERLIREDARLNSDEDASEALAATAKNQRLKGAKNTENKKPKKKKESKELQCYKCQEMGHIARQCRNKRKPHDDGGKSRDCAFVVETSKSSVMSNSKSAENARVLWTQNCIMVADQSEVWLIDSGASRHLTYRRDWLTDYKMDNTGATISLGDNQICNVAGEGMVRIKRLIDGVWHDARIEKVLHVPKLRKNLFSVGVCTKKGLGVQFKNNRIEVVHDGEILATGMKQSNDVYRMFFKVAKQGSTEEANIATTNLTVWHERLGHVGKRAIRELVEKGLVSGVLITDKNDVFCVSNGEIAQASV